MRVVIIEDERPAARRLKRLLEALDIRVEAILHSVHESIDWFQENSSPDLMFLDIQLSDGLSFEIFESVQVDSAIIFTTAYDEYALKAFKFNSVDYLLKPLDKEELKEAMEQYKKSIKQGNNLNLNVDLDRLRTLLINPLDKEYKKRFTSKIGQRLKTITIDEIVCFYSENKTTYIRTYEKRNYPLECSLEDLVHQLDPERFYRVNRKCFVNIDSMEDIISYTNSRLQLKLKGFNELEVIVSREKVKDFKNWLG